MYSRLCFSFDLYVETEQNDVAVFHDIFLTFRANHALVLCGGHGEVEVGKLVEVDDLGADKAAFKSV